MSLRGDKPRSWEMITPEIVNELKKMIEIDWVKTKIKQKISEKRYLELKNLTNKEDI